MAYGYSEDFTPDPSKLTLSDAGDFVWLHKKTDADYATLLSGGKMGVACYDIRFEATNDLGNALPFERELHVTTTGEMVYHVRLPAGFDPTTDKVRIFIGDATVVTDQSNPTGTWSSDHLGVLHWGDGSSLDLNDSTSNNKDGTNTGGVSAGAGLVRGAVVPGSSGAKAVTWGTGDFNIRTGDFAYSFSYKTSSSATMGIFSKARANAANNRYASYMDAGKVHAFFIKSDADQIFCDDPSNTHDGNWHRLAVRMDRDGLMKLLVDGVVVDTADISAYDGQDFDSTSGGLIAVFGNYNDGAGSGPDVIPFNGSLDELRIQSHARSDDWFLSEFNAIHHPDTLGSYSGITAVGGSGVDIAAQIDGAASVTAGLTGLGALAMSVTGLASVTAGLKGLGALAMSVTGLATVAAALKGAGALVTQITGLASTVFTIDQPSSLIWTAVASDSFVRSDRLLDSDPPDMAYGGTDVGDTWLDNGATVWSIAGNHAVNSTTGGDQLLILNRPAGAATDQELEAVFHQPDCGLMTRHDYGSTVLGNGYLLHYSSVDSKLHLYNSGGSGLSQLGADGPVISNGDLVKLRSVGPTHTVYVNGTLAFSRTEGTWTSGYPALYAGLDGTADLTDFVFRLPLLLTPIAASMTGLATFVGNLTGKGALVSSITGVASMQGTPSGYGALVLAATGLASVSASLKGQGALATSMLGVATTQFGDPGEARSTMLGAATFVGNLKGLGRLQASVTGVASLTGTTSIDAALMASILGQASMVGTLSGSVWTPIVPEDTTWINITPDAPIWTRIT